MDDSDPIGEFSLGVATFLPQACDSLADGLFAKIQGG
jgi:hypothetical protein